jgi:hypothetical protein
VQWVGEKWLFSSTSHSFGYGYEAVRIRVKRAVPAETFILFKIIKMLSKSDEAIPIKS